VVKPVYKVVLCCWWEQSIFNTLDNVLIDMEKVAKRGAVVCGRHEDTVAMFQ
jgi:hypothetical protein